MSREGLASQLFAHGIQLQGMKYGQQSVSVYQGSYQNYAAAIKILSFTPGADHTQLEKECTALTSLSHKNILKLYDCFWENNGANYFFVIVTEWCEKDLGQVMKQRADSHFPWREEELWKFTFELVNALAYMQVQGIAHRDIKPENIFLTITKETKLGDFGSARTFLSDTALATLTGTPFYLSPKLREAYLRRTVQVFHNSFKSDVYSLGLTLLSLALLGPPQSLASAQVSDADVQTVICTIPYSYLFKSLLVWMLSVDEAMRCDFKTLNEWLVNTASQQLQFTVPMQKTLDGNQGSVAIWCMQCHKEVDWNSEIEFGIVPLDCEPTTHMFCSSECCRAYISSGNFTCLWCGMAISEQIIGRYCPRQLLNLEFKALISAQRSIDQQQLRKNSWNPGKKSGMPMEEAKEPLEATELKASNAQFEIASPLEEKKWWPRFSNLFGGTTEGKGTPKTTNRRQYQADESDGDRKDLVSSDACCVAKCSCW